MIGAYLKMERERVYKDGTKLVGTFYNDEFKKVKVQLIMVMQNMLGKLV